MLALTREFVARAERDRSLERGRGAFPVPIELKRYFRQDGFGFGDPIVHSSARRADTLASSPWAAHALRPLLPRFKCRCASAAWAGANEDSRRNRPLELPLRARSSSARLARSSK